MGPAFSFMKRFLKAIFIIVLILFLSYLIPFIIENSQNLKEPRKLEDITKKILLKSQKLIVNIDEAQNFYLRARKQVIYQKNKIILFRDFSYSNYLFQKSFEIALNQILSFKEKMRRKEEEFINKLAETKNINSKISEVFERIPLGSDLFKRFIISSAHLKEAENLFKLKFYDKAEKKLEISSFETKNIYSLIENYLKNFYDPKKLREWKNLYNEALNLSKELNVIVVIKDERILKVIRDGKTIKTYIAEFGKNPLEKKIKSGDLATPEGRYKIVEKKGYKKTKYYLALLLNYPNEEDKRRFEEAKKRGLIPKNARIGGLIEIHGDGGKGIDWTEGCVALENEDMKELYNLVSKGTPVYIIGSQGNNNVLSNFGEKSLWKN